MPEAPPKRGVGPQQQAISSASTEPQTPQLQPRPLCLRWQCALHPRAASALRHHALHPSAAIKAAAAGQAQLGAWAQKCIRERKGSNNLHCTVHCSFSTNGHSTPPLPETKRQQLCRSRSQPQLPPARNVTPPAAAWLMRPPHWRPRWPWRGLATQTRRRQRCPRLRPGGERRRGRERAPRRPRPPQIS